MADLTPELLALAAVRLKQRASVNHGAHDQLAARLAGMADRMRESPGQFADLERMSPAERCVAVALAASDNGNDSSAFWHQLGQEVRQWLDVHPIV